MRQIELSFDESRGKNETSCMLPVVRDRYVSSPYGLRGLPTKQVKIDLDVDVVDG